MDKRARTRKLSRQQDGKCFYCGVLMSSTIGRGKHYTKRPWDMTTEHIIPQCMGGKGGNNLVAACVQCNEMWSGFDSFVHRMIKKTGGEAWRFYHMIDKLKRTSLDAWLPVPPTSSKDVSS